MLISQVDFEEFEAFLVQLAPSSEASIYSRQLRFNYPICYFEDDHTWYTTMDEKYRPLVTDEPVEVQDFRKITDHFKTIIYRNHTSNQYRKNDIYEFSVGILAK